MHLVYFVRNSASIEARPFVSYCNECVWVESRFGTGWSRHAFVTVTKGASGTNRVALLFGKPVRYLTI
jgi:hypothetical protein